MDCGRHRLGGWSGVYKTHSPVADYWSAVVTIKRDHRIIRRGPYAVVRHPIYSAGLLALLGTAIAFGAVRGLIGFALVFIGWWLKSRLEETFLERQFGADYAQYKREVKGLIPFVL
jgi:protein-S-isoprenylcysteine O-methyltransferase Ste14